jgi:hypothetical protein
MSGNARKECLEALNSLPSGTRRVKVQTPDGKMLFKRVEEVNPDEDIIQFKKNGNPIVMMGAPGAQKLPPSSPKAAAIQSAREAHLAGNHLLRKVRKRSGEDEIFDTIMKSMASDVASLEFQIEEKVRVGEDPSQIVAKKSRVLKAMSDAWIAHKKASKTESVDIDSEQFSGLFGFIMSTMKQSMIDAGTRREAIETIFNKFSTAISHPSWRSEAKKIAGGG